MNQQSHESESGASRESGHGPPETASRARQEGSAAGRRFGEEGLGEDLVGHAAERASSRADEEKERLTGGMRAVAGALRRGSRELPEDQRAYGRFVEGVADRVEGASRYLDDRGVEDLGRDVTRLARANTPAFLGGAFLLGVIGARFVKSSFEQPRGGSYDREPRRQRPRFDLGETGGDEPRWSASAGLDDGEGDHAHGN